MDMKINSGELLYKVRKESPVIHHITNWVTIYDCAQAVKSLGASPVMAHDPGEASDMANIASALVLNIGTLTSDLIEAMVSAAKTANKNNIPVLLDACGVGATRLRNNKSEKLLDKVRINIIKGNASEIASLAGKDVSTRGVDASEVKDNLAGIARELALRNKSTVVVTGRVDIISDGRRTCLVENGNSLMPATVGTGCMASSVIGAFAAVEKNMLKASGAGLACFEVAAEIASGKSKGPGTFRENLFDELYLLTPRTLNKRQRIKC